MLLHSSALSLSEEVGGRYLTTTARAPIAGARVVF